MNNSFDLSVEQKNFINEALKGKNILVDACIGSGKTTAIQQLCNKISSDNNILYLTYNRLLKIDARSKIKNKNVTVTNYHGFAYTELRKIGIKSGKTDLIQTFIKVKPLLNTYDVLIIDEYQDIEQELSELLEYVKSSNPNIQIIAVGDMQQKIYDKTTLNVSEFINHFLGNFEKLEFTRCFRLSKGIANKLGRIWNKSIIGVNNNCIVEEMNLNQVEDFLSKQNPSDVLCLGSRYGDLSDTLNILESKHPEKYNKKTVYASISDSDSTGSTKPNNDSAIFTTFDSSKGLERKICVVFDFTESYWQVRINKPQQSFEILRNIFCVAASRGKEHIIFVNKGEVMLSEATLSLKTTDNLNLNNINISDMFDFKYKENIEECYSLLNIKCLPQFDVSPIHINNSDGLIDLSPCIGIYQEAVFFDDYEIDKDIELLIELNKKRKNLYNEKIKNSSLEKKILFFTFLDTNQERYINQVETPFIDKIAEKQICNRLSEQFLPDENVQKFCRIDFSKEQNGNIDFSAIGYADVIKDNIVYELKFVSELNHEHFLQCASYIIALNLEKGILWNTRNNSMYEITIPDKKQFLDSVTKTITKQNINEYYQPQNDFNMNPDKYFAVIDTETNWSDQVMSIGVVVADSETFELIDKKYYIISPEYLVGGMFSYALDTNESINKTVITREEAINKLCNFFMKYNIKSLFAYNANFDRKHLPELHFMQWYDIMKIAAYKQYNLKIPNSSPCCDTGRLKRNYGVEPILRILSENYSYTEKHHALTDAIDELKIMQLLGLKLDVYKHANESLIKNKPTQTINDSKIKIGTKVKVKKFGIGVIEEINDLIIKISVNGKSLTYTRKDSHKWISPINN